jgi:hypothetical protein
MALLPGPEPWHITPLGPGLPEQAPSVSVKSSGIWPPNGLRHPTPGQCRGGGQPGEMARAKAVPIPWFIRATCVVTAWFWFVVRTGPAPWRRKTVQWPPPRENDPPDRFLTLVDQVRTPAHACAGWAERPPQAPLGPESRRAAPPGRARERGLGGPTGATLPFHPTREGAFAMVPAEYRWKGVAR